MQQDSYADKACDFVINLVHCQYLVLCIVDYFLI